MFTLYEQSGLGLVVRATTKFDPRRMAAREAYWYKIYFDYVVNEMADNYRAAGFAGISGTAPGMIPTHKIPVLRNVIGTIGKIPVVGKLICGIFGGCKKPKIPWGKINAEAAAVARPIAKETAMEEENARIQEENVRIATERQTAVEKKSQEGAAFKLPEGVTSISRGALVMKLKGGPTEKRK
jgi:hypothetical protein